MEPILKDTSEKKGHLTNQDNYFGPKGVCTREVPAYIIASHISQLKKKLIIIILLCYADHN